MAIVRLVELVLVGALGGVALVSAIGVALIVGWMAVAVPTIGLGTAGTALSHLVFGGPSRTTGR